MRPASLLARVIGPVLAGLFLAALVHQSAASAAVAIPAEAAASPKILWRLVMEGYYGPYDKRRKCWTARIAADRVCMRPHRLDQVSIRGVDHLFLVIAGVHLGADGQPQEAHVDSGALGLIILKRDGASLKLVASNLHQPFGSFGRVPSEEQFTLSEIGPEETYGWVATSGWMGQGHFLTSATIFAPVGDAVVSIGNIPNHYDNEGNCDNGKLIGTETPCTDYSAELSFDSSDRGSRFYPVVVTVKGSREGATLDQTFRTRFDAQKSAYERIEGLPEEFANGI